MERATDRARIAVERWLIACSAATLLMTPPICHTLGCLLLSTLTLTSLGCADRATDNAASGGVDELNEAPTMTVADSETVATLSSIVDIFQVPEPADAFYEPALFISHTGADPSKGSRLWFETGSDHAHSCDLGLDAVTVTSASYELRGYRFAGVKDVVGANGRTVKKPFAATLETVLETVPAGMVPETIVAYIVQTDDGYTATVPVVHDHVPQAWNYFSKVTTSAGGLTVQAYTHGNESAVTIWPIQLSFMLQASTGQPKPFVLNHVDFLARPSVTASGANTFRIDGAALVWREDPRTSGGDWVPKSSTFEVKLSVQNGQISDAVTVTRMP